MEPEARSVTNEAGAELEVEDVTDDTDMEPETHPIPTAQNEPVVTLSELITFVSISPSEVWTVYYYLGVYARRYGQCPYIRRSLIGDMDIFAISTGFPGNPH
jgi:hypothetical protein